MDEFLRGLGWTALGIGVLSAVAAERVRHAADRDIEAMLPGARVHVSVVPRGLFGMAFGDAERATVRGGGFRTERLPFELEPGGGLRARLGTLRLELKDVTLRNLRVESLVAEIPRVRVDALRALVSGHLTLRSAGEGSGEAVITAEDLRRFLAEKLPQMQEMRVTLRPGEAILSARAAILLAPAPFEARARVGIREGRYLEAIDASVRMGDRELPAALTNQLLASLNPIIDTEKDLRLGAWLFVTGASVEEGTLRVRGRVTIPKRERP